MGYPSGKAGTGHIRFVVWMTGCILAFFWGTVWAQPPDLSSGAFLRSWFLCGPFSNPSHPTAQKSDEHFTGFARDQLDAIGGEKTPVIHEGVSVTDNGVPLTWRRFCSENDWVDLAKAICPGEGILGYAYCEIPSAQQTLSLFTLGANDGCRAWVNGKEVCHAVKSTRRDELVAPVILRAGLNTLLIKIENRGRDWGFYCRLLPFTTHDLLDPFQMITVDVKPSREPIMRILWPDLLTSGMLKNPKAVLIREGLPDEPIWQTETFATAAIPLPVNDKDYSRYQLTFSAEGIGETERYACTIPFFCGDRREYALFRDGSTPYEIVLSDTPSESEKWAARELQQTLTAISGASFPLRSLSERSRAQYRIVMGESVASQLYPADSFPKPVTDECFSYRNRGPDIVMLGGPHRGILYAVTSFLEREFGCRWYAPNASVIPARNEYLFNHLAHAERPGLSVRALDMLDAFDADWAARNRLNGASASGTNVVGGKSIRKVRDQIGGLETFWEVHTFGKLMPSAEFFPKHPEYYSLIDGKRRGGDSTTQLCLTNPEVLRILIKRVKAVMKEQPQHLIYDISQNDGDDALPCQCDKCRALAQSEGSESGPIIWFVNQVADAVKRDFPDKYIGTLAYAYSEKPPRTLVPHDNVVIRLAGFYNCFAHSFDSCSLNASYAESLQEWSRISRHLYLWDYSFSCNHFPLPFPDFWAAQSHVRFYRDHKAIGVMPQGVSLSPGGDLAPLRAYVWARLLWNPDCNLEEVINDFMYGYYGRSGLYMRQYLDLLHQRITPDTHLRVWQKPQSNLYSDAFVDMAESLFNQAEKVAETPEIMRRVQAARFAVDYLKCYRKPLCAKQDGTYERVQKGMARSAITHFSETPDTDKAAFEKMMANTNSP